MGDLVSSQGVTFTWRNTAFTATSVQYKSDAAAEYDITAMSVGSVLTGIVSDPENTNIVRIAKSYDYAVIERGEITVDFFSNTAAFGLTACVGFPGSLSFKQTQEDTGNPFYSQIGGQTELFNITTRAYLTSFSFGARVGEYISGNCTFKLSDT